MDIDGDDPNGPRDWFPSQISGVLRLNQSECTSDLDRIHANLSRIEERPSIDTETKTTKKARTIEKIMANVPAYQLLREEHSTLRSVLDQLRSDIANFKDTSAQTRKHTLLAQRESALYQYQIEALRGNFRFESSSSESARQIYTILSEGLANSLYSLYASRYDSETRCMNLTQLFEKLLLENNEWFGMIEMNKKFDTENFAYQTLLKAILEKVFAGGNLGVKTQEEVEEELKELVKDTDDLMKLEIEEDESEWSDGVDNDDIDNINNEGSDMTDSIEGDKNTNKDKNSKDDDTENKAKEHEEEKEKHKKEDQSKNKATATATAQEEEDPLVSLIDAASKQSSDVDTHVVKKEDKVDTTNDTNMSDISNPSELKAQKRTRANDDNKINESGTSNENATDKSTENTTKNMTKENKDISNISTNSLPENENKDNSSTNLQNKRLRRTRPATKEEYSLRRALRKERREKRKAKYQQLLSKLQEVKLEKLPQKNLVHQVFTVFRPNQLKIFRLLFESFKDPFMLRRFLDTYASEGLDKLMDLWEIHFEKIQRDNNEDEDVAKVAKVTEVTEAIEAGKIEKEKGVDTATEDTTTIDTTTNPASVDSDGSNTLGAPNTLGTQKVEDGSDKSEGVDVDAESSELGEKSGKSVKSVKSDTSPSTPTPTLSHSSHSITPSPLYLFNGTPTGYEGLDESLQSQLSPDMVELRRGLLSRHREILNFDTGLFQPTTFFKLLQYQASHIVHLQEKLREYDSKLHRQNIVYCSEHSRASGLQLDLTRSLSIVEALRQSLEQSEVEKQILSSQVQASDAKLEYLQQEIVHLQSLRTADEAKLHSLIECVAAADTRASEAESSLAETVHEIRITQTANETMQDAYDRLLDDRNAFARALIHISDELSLMEQSGGAEKMANNLHALKIPSLVNTLTSAIVSAAASTTVAIPTTATAATTGAGAGVTGATSTTSISTVPPPVISTVTVSVPVTTTMDDGLDGVRSVDGSQIKAGATTISTVASVAHITELSQVSQLVAPTSFVTSQSLSSSTMTIIPKLEQVATAAATALSSVAPPSVAPADATAALTGAVDAASTLASTLASASESAPTTTTATTKSIAPTDTVQDTTSSLTTIVPDMTKTEMELANEILADSTPLTSSTTHAPTSTSTSTSTPASAVTVTVTAPSAPIIPVIPTIQTIQLSESITSKQQRHLIHELQIRLAKYLANNRHLVAELRVAEEVQRITSRENRKLMKQLSDITGTTSSSQIDLLDVLEPRLRTMGQAFNSALHLSTASVASKLTHSDISESQYNYAVLNKNNMINRREGALQAQSVDRGKANEGRSEGRNESREYRDAVQDNNENRSESIISMTDVTDAVTLAGAVTDNTSISIQRPATTNHHNESKVIKSEKNEKEKTLDIKK